MRGGRRARVGSWIDWRVAERGGHQDSNGSNKRKTLGIHAAAGKN